MSAALLAFDRVALSRDDGVVLVDDLSLEVGRGEILALVGESGSGKTLAARSALRLLPSGVTQSSGRILFDGKDMADLTASELRACRGRRIGLVLQEPLTALNPALRIGDQLIEGLMREPGVKRAEALERAAAMLERVRIKGGRELLRRYPHEFSGGMRQRIMLASVFLTRPELIIADEPTTALDTISQREVLDIMVELGADAGAAVLLITHNLGLAARYAHRVAVMRAGRLVESGEAKEVLGRPRADYTRALLDAAPKLGAGPRPRPDTLEGAPLLEVRDLTVDYGPRRFRPMSPPAPVLRGVSLTVRTGEFVAVVGGSGSGKTTLGRTIMGLTPPRGGVMRFDGEVLGPARTQAFRAQTQMVFQDPYSSLNPRRRIGDIVGDPLRLDTRLDDAARRARVADMLESVGMGDYIDRLPHQLSGGQRQRVAIARALIRNPRLIVADEPTSALDVTVQAQVLRLLKQMQQDRGFACVFISHDLAVVSSVASRIVILDEGQVVEEGSCDEILRRPQRPYTAALIAATPHL